MKFYNRGNELSRLSEIANLFMKAAHMVVFTGRRRVGKIELIHQFARGKK